MAGWAAGGCAHSEAAAKARAATRRMVAGREAADLRAGKLFRPILVFTFSNFIFDPPYNLLHRRPAFGLRFLTEISRYIAVNLLD
jgi:hypothetical protein